MEDLVWDIEKIHATLLLSMVLTGVPLEQLDVCIKGDQVAGRRVSFLGTLHGT